MPYIDGFALAVPTANKAAYQKYAQNSALAFRDNGALNFVVCWGDAIPGGQFTSFPLAVQCKADETVVLGWITWPSKQVRDAGMEKAMLDTRLHPKTETLPFDGMRMIFGGFDMLVNV